MIYGVRCVAAQTEVGIEMLCDLIQEDFPHVAAVLRRHRYVDDLAKSTHTKKERDELISDSSIRVQHKVKYFKFCLNKNTTNL